jgi:hypothetical protein
MLILVDNTAFRINAFAVNFDETWKPFSITDSALLHATLCLVAQHEDLLAGRESEENLFHKGEVMRLMNGRLRESGREISDADVTTVAMLVVLEVRCSFGFGRNEMADSWTLEYEWDI